jgi:hypothetical protein
MNDSMNDKISEEMLSKILRAIDTYKKENQTGYIPNEHYQKIFIKTGLMEPSINPIKQARDFKLHSSATHLLIAEQKELYEIALKWIVNSLKACNGDYIFATNLTVQNIIKTIEEK